MILDPIETPNFRWHFSAKRGTFGLASGVNSPCSVRTTLGRKSHTQDILCRFIITAASLFPRIDGLGTSIGELVMMESWHHEKVANT
jgi:hypothetical protein